MTLVALRQFNGIVFYGYVYGNDTRPFWSMRFYPQTWYAPVKYLD